MWQLVLSRQFLKALRTAGPDVRKAVDGFIAAHQDGIADPTRLAGICKLAGEENFYRLRFGRWRVGIEVEPERRLVILRWVGARGVFYKHFPSR
jgi:mRNA-degrading endonuclease RelE of RelBE toxin-antitoxin system